MSGEKKQIPTYMKFVIGGLAGMGGVLFIQPLDLVKNRMQLSGEKNQSTLKVIKTIIEKEGYLGLYAGLSAGLLRQSLYASVRIGTFSYLFGELSGPDGRPPNLPTKLLMGIFSGAAGAFAATPADVALVRMTADGRLPPSERRNYKNVFNALTRIVSEEGPLTLWKGVLPTMGRAMVANTAQLATYSQTKQSILQRKLMNEGIALHFLSSLVAGFFIAVTSLPVDIAKTRIQNMKTTNGKPPYSGMFDALYKIVKYEGVPALWSGFVPYFSRATPFSVISLLLLEQLTIAYYKFVLGDDSGKGSI